MRRLAINSNTSTSFFRLRCLLHIFHFDLRGSLDSTLFVHLRKLSIGERIKIRYTILGLDMEWNANEIASTKSTIVVWLSIDVRVLSLLLLLLFCFTLSLLFANKSHVIADRISFEVNAHQRLRDGNGVRMRKRALEMRNAH